MLKIRLALLWLREELTLLVTAGPEPWRDYRRLEHQRETCGRLHAAPAGEGHLSVPR